MGALFIKNYFYLKDELTILIVIIQTLVLADIFSKMNQARVPTSATLSITIYKIIDNLKYFLVLFFIKSPLTRTQRRRSAQDIT